MEKNRHHQAFETTTAMKKSCNSIFPISALYANVCILPKALIMAKWNQDYSLTTSSKRHLALWISKVKSSGVRRLGRHKRRPLLGFRSLIGATGGVTALWFTAECCQNPCHGVPGLSSLMTQPFCKHHQASGSGGEADLSPRAEKKGKWRAFSAITQPLNKWPGRDTTTLTLLGCVSGFNLAITLNVCFPLILQIFMGKENILRASLVAQW